MAQRKRRVKSDRKKFNNCAYCMNHDEQFPARGHRGKCKYNVKEHLDKCIPCKKNQKKTVTMQKYREKNFDSKNDATNIAEVVVAVPVASSDNEDSWIPYDDYEIPSENEEHLEDDLDGTNDESMSFDNSMSDTEAVNRINSETQESPLTTEPPKFTIIIMAQHYPFKILSKKYADEFMTAIDNLPGTSTADGLRIQYKIYEKGFIKILCLDENTKNVVLEVARQFKLRFPKQKIIVINESDFVSNIKMSCVLRNAENFFTGGDEFLKEIQEKNMLNTSGWVVEEAIYTPEPPNPPEQQKFCFDVDLLSASYISSRSFYLDIKDGCFQICVRNREELQRMYASSLV